MFSFTKVQCLLLLTLIETIAVGHSLVLSQVVTDENVILQVTNQKEERQSTWDRIIAIFRRKKGDASTHGDEFCPVSPNVAAYEIWREQPLFVWEGKVKKIVVLDRNHSEPALLWSYTVTAGEQSALYDGSPLQPAQEYWVEYEVINSHGETLTEAIAVPFLILEAEKRQNIQNQLREQGLDTQDSAMGVEDFALQRAVFFAKQDLFSDVIAELFSISSPSSDWNSTIQELRSEFCK